MKKTLLVHDLPENAPLLADLPGSFFVVDAKAEASPCVGCFGCWVKTPGRCVIQDALYDLTTQAAQSGELVVISRCVYGGYSPDVKRVMDRLIGYMLPFFEITQGEMHHTSRYEDALNGITALFYDADAGQRETAEALVAANARNIAAKTVDVRFFDSPEAMKGAIPCV